MRSPKRGADGGVRPVLLASLSIRCTCRSSVASGSAQRKQRWQVPGSRSRKNSTDVAVLEQKASWVVVRRGSSALGSQRHSAIAEKVIVVDDEDVYLKAI